MKIAITGGIGSGKSYVCRILEKQGIRVYDCDAGAKRLMRTDAGLQAGLKKLVGEEVYSAEGVLQKPVLAQFLLAGEANKQAVNDVVHPAVARDFEQSSYEWMESAILFDSGFYRRIHLDFVVCVTAPVTGSHPAHHAARSYLGREGAAVDRCRHAAGRTCSPLRFRNRERWRARDIEAQVSKFDCSISVIDI